LRQVAVNKTADALAASGSAFSTDDDPELIRDAAPFSLKLMEGLLAETPRHRGLLLSMSSNFTQYAYAFVQQESERLQTSDLAASESERQRARRLYRRARDYGLRGLDTAHKSFSEALRADPGAALAAAKRQDVALLYWTAVSWAALISLSKDDPEIVADLPLVEALIDRALALDESFDAGAIHGFLVTYEMVRQNAWADREQRARQHFARAVQLSGGMQAAPYVSLAESVAIVKQDRAEFERVLGQALSIDVNQRREWRLANVVMQERARWLLAHSDQFFAQ
jgi:predicted anti-sigma-YlaC factor YlaD